MKAIAAGMAASAFRVRRSPAGAASKAARSAGGQALEGCGGVVVSGRRLLLPCLGQGVGDGAEPLTVQAVYGAEAREAGAANVTELLAVKPNSPGQLAKIPPRTPKPTPAARMAMKPVHMRRPALGVIPSGLMFAPWGLIVARALNSAPGFVAKDIYDHGVLELRTGEGDQ